MINEALIVSLILLFFQIYSFYLSRLYTFVICKRLDILSNYSKVISIKLIIYSYFLFYFKFYFDYYDWFFVIRKWKTLKISIFLWFRLIIRISNLTSFILKVITVNNMDIIDNKFFFHLLFVTIILLAIHKMQYIKIFTVVFINK